MDWPRLAVPWGGPGLHLALGWPAGEQFGRTLLGGVFNIGLVQRVAIAQLLRPQLEVALGDGMDASRSGFVHQKLLVEGLTAWPAHALQAPSGGSDLLCPPEIAGDGVQLVMTKGFSGTNGTKYVCDLAEFEVLHGTGNLVLKRLEPEARLRLAARLSEPEGVVV